MPNLVHLCHAHVLFVVVMSVFVVVLVVVLVVLCVASGVL